MKTVTMRALQQNMKQSVDQAQVEPVVITRHGKPAALVLGVEGEDWETVLVRSDKRFWSMISERRGEPTLSRGELEQRLSSSKPRRAKRGRK